jgi:glycosyltransferase involved in cell wall biosynthesis
MKILIVNYRFFVSGGPERYLFNIMSLLERKGHTVIPFSVQNHHNQPSAYSDYFMSPVGEGKEVYFNEYNKRNPKTLWKTFSRMFYSREAKRKLTKLIRDTRPDLVYVLHYQNKMSASVFDAAAACNVPVIHRVSDFSQLCANGLFYRPVEKDTCERCLKGTKLNAVRYKCVHNSYMLSAVKAASLKLQQLMRLDKKIAAYVVPSGFTISKLALSGLPAAKLHHIPTFFNFSTKQHDMPVTYGNYALFVGRVEEEKGLQTLVDAFIDTPYALKIVGGSSSGFDEKLKSCLRGKVHQIEFLGQLPFNDIQQYLAGCAFTVMPTEVYDNFPNTVLESYAFSKPVLATNVGSLREIVSDGETGLLFPLKDAAALRAQVHALMEDPARCRKLGEGAFRKLNNSYSEEQHYTKLMHCFESVITRPVTQQNRDATVVKTAVN